MSRYLVLASLVFAGCAVDANSTEPTTETDTSAIALGAALPVVYNGTLSQGATTVRLWDPSANDLTSSFWAGDANHMTVIYSGGDTPDGATDNTMYAWLIADTAPKGSAGNGPSYIYRIWRVLPGDKNNGTFQFDLDQVFASQQATLGQGALAVSTGAPAGGTSTGGPHIGHGGDGTVAWPSGILNAAVNTAQASLSAVRGFRVGLANYTFPTQ